MAVTSDPSRSFQRAAGIVFAAAAVWASAAAPAMSSPSAEERLGKLVSTISAKMGDRDTRTAFEGAQAAWARDVTATCDVTLRSLYRGGSFAVSMPADCRNRMAEQRIALLTFVFRSTLRN